MSKSYEIGYRFHYKKQEYEITDIGSTCYGVHPITTVQVARNMVRAGYTGNGEDKPYATVKEVLDAEFEGEWLTGDEIASWEAFRREEEENIFDYDVGHKFFIGPVEYQITDRCADEGQPCYGCLPSKMFEVAKKEFEEDDLCDVFGNSYESFEDFLNDRFPIDEFITMSQMGIKACEERILQTKEILPAPAHSVIILDYSLGGEGNIEVLGVYHSSEEAKDAFMGFARDARKTAEERDWYIAEEFSTCFVAYKTGYYPSDHTRIFIQEVKKK